MKIEQIKQELLNYKDFYGGDISDTDAIKNATTKKQLSDILWKHENFLDDMLSDAKRQIENFRRKTGLRDY